MATDLRQTNIGSLGDLGGGRSAPTPIVAAGRGAQGRGLWAASPRLRGPFAANNLRNGGKSRGDRRWR